MKTVVLPPLVALFIAAIGLASLASCANSATGPSTNFVTNLVTSNYGPLVRCNFLTGTNIVKVGVSRSLGGGIFAVSAEFSHLSPSDLVPTGYAVLPTQTNYNLGYTVLWGTVWTNWVVGGTTYLLSNNVKYTVFVSGDWAALTNGTGVLSLVQD